jgi:hypothetical protein
MFGINFGLNRETQYQEGYQDRVAGKLPRKKNFNYLEGYLKDRTGGLDAVVQYFPTMEDYMRWKLNHTNYSS